MMPDFRDRWVVVIGKEMYVAGLGRTLAGYRDGIGTVITHRRELALEYTSLRDAKGLAESIGGRVFKVDPTEKDRSAATETAPGQMNPEPFYQKGGQDANERPGSSGLVHDWRYEGRPVNAWPAASADARQPDPD